MEVVYGVLGGTLVALVLLDALWTTLWVDGSAGPLTGRVSTHLWRLGLRAGRGRHRALSALGPVILVTTVALWILGLWAGWTLVFASDPRALGLSSGPGFAGWTGRIWFVSYTMFTVGNGDFTPADGAWQVVSGLVAATGMSLVTLAVTYLLNVLSAVVGKRAFAEQVHGFGHTPEDLVLAGWNGHDLHPLDRQLTELASQLSRITQQYLSYPVLQYYHAAGVAKSPVKAAAVLDEALTLLRFGVDPAARPDPAALTTARSAVRSLLDDTLEASAIRPAPEPPPPPRLERLRSAGVPVVGDQEFDEAVRDLADRRRTMLGLVRGDGWEWED